MILYEGANAVLINITGGLDMTLFEVDEAANRYGKLTLTQPLFLDQHSMISWMALSCVRCCHRYPSNTQGKPTKHHPNKNRSRTLDQA